MMPSLYDSTLKHTCITIRKNISWTNTSKYSYKKSIQFKGINSQSYIIAYKNWSLSSTIFYIRHTQSSSTWHCTEHQHTTPHAALSHQAMTKFSVAKWTQAPDWRAGLSKAICRHHLASAPLLVRNYDVKPNSRRYWLQCDSGHWPSDRNSLRMTLNMVYFRTRARIFNDVTMKIVYEGICLSTGTCTSYLRRSLHAKHCLKMQQALDCLYIGTKCAYFTTPCVQEKKHMVCVCIATSEYYWTAKKNLG